MADEEKTRSVRLAEDAEDNTIHYVGHLRKTEVKEGSGDPFAKRAEDIKTLPGTSAVFKRRVTNEIKKFQQGLGGEAKTKQIQEKEFVTGYNAFDVVEPNYNLEYLAKLYELSSPHYAAVNAKVDNIVGLGYRFVETRKSKRNLESIADDEKKTKKRRRELDEHRDELLDLIKTFNEEDVFIETLIKVWRDYEVTGNGYIEIGRKRDGTIGYIGHIPSQTMRIRKRRDGFVQMSGFRVQFFAPYRGIDPDTSKPFKVTNPIGNDTPNEVIHLKNYSPTSGYYGVPDIIAAKQAIAGNEFAARFNLDYFENKAVPRYVITLKGAKLGAQAEANLLSFFETGLKGQNHRSLYIPLPAGSKENPVEFKMDAVENGTQDSSFVNYKKSNDKDILMAHRVFESKVSISGGIPLAAAKDADKTFKEQVCAPRQKVLEEKLNKIFAEFTDAFELKLNEMTLTDEDTQSKIDERNVKAGIDLPNEVRARKGQPGVKGGNERVDLNAKANSAAQQNNDSNANRQRNSERSANATDSAGAARNPKGEGRTTP